MATKPLNGATRRDSAVFAPHARREIVADAGHIVWLDQPKRCAALTIEFLKSG
jgi:pimeloyl-ACP methyl ester carboxylesterase